MIQCLAPHMHHVSGVIDLTFMGRVGCSTTRGLWLVTCMQLALAGGTPAEWFLLEGRGKKHCFCLRGGVREPAKHSSTKLSGNREVLFVGGLGWVSGRPNQRLVCPNQRMRVPCEESKERRATAKEYGKPSLQWMAEHHL